MTDRALKVVLLVLFALMTCLRLVYLNSDNSTNIDFSFGQITDESYYTMNARNQVNFGEAHLDEFNNMLLTPLLHYVDVADFKLLGVGPAQARTRSVMFGMLSILLLFLALKEAFGLRVAALGAVLLGFDQVFFFFNREALMDTPSCFPAMLAFYLFVKGIKSPRNALWLLCCGLAIALAATTRYQQIGLTAAPFIAFFLAKRPIADYAKVAVGIGVGVAVYMALWYLPHHAEIAKVNAFNATQQWLPKSLRDVVFNIGKGFIRPEGVIGYYARHSTVLLICGFVGLAACLGLVRSKTDGQGRRMVEGLTAAFLGAYCIALLTEFAIVSYAPGRYLSILVPSLAGLAAIGYMRRQEALAVLQDRRWLRALAYGLGIVLLFHLVTVAIELAPHASYDAMGTKTKVLLRLAIAAVAVGCLYFARRGLVRWPMAYPLVFLAMNAITLIEWRSSLSYVQYDLGRWVNANLPQDAIIVDGAHLGMETKRHVLCVLEKYSNDDHPLARNADKPLYLVRNRDFPRAEKDMVGFWNPPTEFKGEALASATLVERTKLLGRAFELYRIRVK